MLIEDQYVTRLNTARFRHPPPTFENVRAPFAQAVKPPYEGAPGWQCSVYYFWYEYLRRHEGYRDACQTGGVGPFAEQLATFGNVHELDFARWWGQHFDLFAEPNPAFLVHKRQLQRGESIQRSAFIEYMQIDLRFSETDIVRRVRDLVRISKSRIGYKYEKHLEDIGADTEPAKQFKKRRRVISHAQYRVTSRPSLPALHQHLAVWDAKHAHPSADDVEVYFIAKLTTTLPYSEDEIAELKADGLKVSDLEKANHRAKRLAVQRHLRIAQQYIANVVNGEFPKRSKR